MPGAKKPIKTIVARKSALRPVLLYHAHQRFSVVAIVLAIVVVVGIRTTVYAAGDPRDLPYVLSVVNRTLESERTQVTVTWSNPETGNSGTVVIERTFYPSPETPCRDYRRTANLSGGSVAVIKGTGCRTGAGHWKA